MKESEGKKNERARERERERGREREGEGVSHPRRWNIIDTPLFCFPPENQYRRSAAPLRGEVALAGDKSQCPENPRRLAGRATPVKLRESSRRTSRAFPSSPREKTRGARTSVLHTEERTAVVRGAVGHTRG